MIKNNIDKLIKKIDEYIKENENALLKADYNTGAMQYLQGEINAFKRAKSMIKLFDTLEK